MRVIPQSHVHTLNSVFIESLLYFYTTFIVIHTNLGLAITKQGAFDSQPQVIKFTSCLPMVGGSLWVLRLLPPPKRVAMI